MKVLFFATLQQAVGSSEVDVELEPGATVRQLLAALASDYPVLSGKVFDEDGNLQHSLNVLLNGRHIRYLDGLDSNVSEDDRIALFPSVGGG